MGSFAVGEIILLPFPFADFSQFKKRPALIVGHAEFDNLIVCQITSSANTSRQAVLLRDKDFEIGSLQRDSYVRPDKLFTIEPAIIEASIGLLKSAKIRGVRTQIKRLFD